MNLYVIREIIHYEETMKKKEKKKQGSSASKRPFSKLSEESTPVPKLGRLKLVKNNQKKEIHYFSWLPQYLIEKILIFLPKHQYSGLKFVNKEFYARVSKLFKTIDFKRKNNIPSEIFLKIMSNLGKPEELRFGALLNLSSEMLLDKMIPSLNLRELRVLDFNNFSDLNDIILLSCLEKTNAKNMNEICLPYSSKITNNSLEFIAKNFSCLDVFILESKFCHTENKNLKQETIAKIFKNNKLIKFHIEIIDEIFLLSLAESDLEPLITNVIKIKHLQLKEMKDIKHLSILGSVCPFIQKLVLMEIFVKNNIVQQDHLEILEVFKSLFQSFKLLTFLKMGHFTTPALMDLITENTVDLQCFKVISEKLTIEDLQLFFLECFSLVRLSGSIGREYKYVTFQKTRITLFIS